MSSATGVSYNYNADGDMTRSGDLYFDYTPFHRVSQVMDDNNAIIYSFGYDASGQRVYKQSDTVTEIFLRGSDGNILADLDGSGFSKTEYVYLNGKMVAKIEDPFHDSDGDGLSDQEEGLLGTNPDDPDSDDDGLSDGYEIAIGTYPLDSDSDDDGIADGDDPYPMIHLSLHPFVGFFPSIYHLLLLK